jgi:hypothetical protein
MRLVSHWWLAPDEDPVDFATRLEATCYGLTLAAERALADGSR